MRVTNQLISTTNACALYNKGVSRVVVPVACNANKAREVLKKENKEKMLNYLDIPNNCVLSLSLSLSHSTITLSFLTVYVLTQCVARYSVSTKDFLIVPFVVCCFCLINSFFLIYSDWNHVDKHGQCAVCVLAPASQCGFLIPHYVI